MNSKLVILKVNKQGLILIFIEDINLRDSQFYSGKWGINHEEFK